MTAEAPTPSQFDAQTLFGAIRDLGPLRIISICGPSVFEAIEELGPFGVRDGWLNAINDRFHWHLEVARIGWVTTRDQVHERSGRRVLFFELRETRESDPFLLLYLHRAKGEEFGEARQRLFAGLHEHFAGGSPLEANP